MTTHTKGPWTVTEQDAEGHFTVQGNSGAAVICYGAGWYGEENPGPANARLIAAAPDMLEWLEWSVKHLPQCQIKAGGCGECRTCAARALLAKIKED